MKEKLQLIGVNIIYFIAMVSLYVANIFLIDLEGFRFGCSFVGDVMLISLIVEGVTLFATDVKHGIRKAQKAKKQEATVDGI